MNEKAKSAAIITLAKKEDDSIFIAWFPATFTWYKTLFQREGIPENRVMEARHFHPAKVLAKQLIFLEHHPLRSKETALLKDFPGAGINVYNSLDEPLFASFGSDRIIEMMKKMGMNENEAITHALISKSIAKAQEKTEKKITVEMDAPSQKEWMERNVK